MATKIQTPVFTVADVAPHPNADRLEIVQALGWQVVCGKGLRKAGQKCIYVQPDSIVPDEWSEQWGVKDYLKGKAKNRVGQIRLRGEPSFGFIVDVPIHPHTYAWKDGDDVSEYFGITKYEPPVKTSCGDAEVACDLFPEYTDIENLRNYPDVFEEDEMVVATEKIHGSNLRLGIVSGE